MAARRIVTINGDVSRDGLGLNDADRALFTSADTVIHSAAAVSFDSPLDSAVEINLMGPTRIAHLLNEVGVAPHLVAVSTCYVAGNRRGTAPEALVSAGPFDIGLDWRREVAAARRLRGDAEAASRMPDQLAEFRHDARVELGAAGAPALAAKTEQLRERWVKDQLVTAGRTRAASVGWPDAYAFTKALGEQALTEEKGAVPVSIVRPSIIESVVGGAEPGLDPRVPHGRAGHHLLRPRPAQAVPRRAGGHRRRDPRRHGGRVDHRRRRARTGACAGDHPGRLGFGQPAEVPDARRQRAGLVPRPPAVRPRGPADPRARLDVPRPRQGAGAAHPGQDGADQGRADAAAAAAAGQARRPRAKLETKRMEVERALEYVELYGLYTECEAIYQVDNLLAIWDGLDAADQEAFCFDPRVVDWPTYVSTIHLPSVVEHARVKTTPGKTTIDRPARLRRNVLSPDRHLAAFDLENTLIASNVVESYSWLATRRLNTPERIRYALRTVREGPGLLAMDRKDRSDFLRHFYRRYEDAPAEQIATDAQELLSALIVTKSFPAGIRRVREHRALGHRTILITGALSFAVEGLRPLFDEIVAAEMTIRPDGTYSGELAQVPPTGETRAQVMADYCAAEGLRLDQSIAYADSTSDLPMLEAVGFPVAVNPETRLAAIARKRGWLVENWAKAPGGPRPLLPIGPLLGERERRRSFRGVSAR